MYIKIYLKSDTKFMVRKSNSKWCSVLAKLSYTEVKFSVWP